MVKTLYLLRKDHSGHKASSALPENKHKNFKYMNFGVIFVYLKGLSKESGGNDHKTLSCGAGGRERVVF